jgi:hypothetical protein
VADDVPELERLPDHEYGHTEYVVGDYINLELTIYHGMHLLEARAVFTHQDDALEVVVAGEPELGEAEAVRMISTLRVSRRVTLEDTPGSYALSRMEIVAGDPGRLAPRGRCNGALRQPRRDGDPHAL